MKIVSAHPYAPTPSSPGDLRAHDGEGRTENAGLGHPGPRHEPGLVMPGMTDPTVLLIEQINSPILLF